MYLKRYVQLILIRTEEIAFSFMLQQIKITIKDCLFKPIRKFLETQKLSKPCAVTWNFNWYSFKRFFCEYSNTKISVNVKS